MASKQRKTAVVTGAGRGVGRAISIALARAGYDIVLVSMSAQLLKETAQRVRRHGRRGIVCPTNLARPAQIKTLGKRIRRQVKSVDLLVNCAFGHIGEDQGKSLVDVSPDELVAFASTSIIGTWLVTREIAPLLQVNRGRAIFIVADWGFPQHNVFLSTAGDAAVKLGSEAYASAKHAITGLANTIERMLGIQATGIYPGIIASMRPSKSTDRRPVYFDLDDPATEIESEEAYAGGWAIPLADISNSVLFAASTTCTVKAILLKPAVTEYDGLHV